MTRMPNPALTRRAHNVIFLVRDPPGGAGWYSGATREDTSIVSAPHDAHWSPRRPRPVATPSDRTASYIRTFAESRASVPKAVPRLAGSVVAWVVAPTTTCGQLVPMATPRRSSAPDSSSHRPSQPVELWVPPLPPCIHV